MQTNAGLVKGSDDSNLRTKPATHSGRSKTTIVPRPTASNTGWAMRNVLVDVQQQRKTRDEGEGGVRKQAGGAD